ncbi:MAG: galactokinase family protein [Corynebacterium sp.]|nr:galactokinase family protein [Corynebacterium sp.]
MDNLSAQCQAAHATAFENPDALAVAPTTWLLLGEHTEAYGGITLASGLDYEVAVAISPRSDHQLLVQETWAGSSTTSQCSYNDADQVYSSPGSLTTPVSTALRAAMIVYALNFRQILHHLKHGLNITILSDVRPDAGIGTQAAADVALALALVSGLDHSEDAPLRAKIADACYQVSKIVDTPMQPRCRFTATLRGRAEHLMLIDDIDDSVKYVPNRLTRGSTAPTLYLMSLPDTAQADDLEPRATFFQQAATAFAADSLRQLPDATTRVMAWLQANHEVRGPKGFVALQDAENWLGFAQQEISRVFEAERALNSRGNRSMFQILNESQRDLGQYFGIGARQAALAELACTWQALAARANYAGVGDTVLALVDHDSVPEFLQQARAAKIAVLPVELGGTARSYNVAAK